MICRRCIPTILKNSSLQQPEEFRLTDEEAKNCISSIFLAHPNKDSINMYRADNLYGHAATEVLAPRDSFVASIKCLREGSKVLLDTVAAKRGQSDDVQALAEYLYPEIRYPGRKNSGPQTGRRRPGFRPSPEAYLYPRNESRFLDGDPLGGEG